MAVITKIRNHSVLLLITIGVAMLAFILGDLFSNGGSFFQSQVSDVGEIYGEPISYKSFETRLENELAKSFGSRPVDEQTRQSARQNLWNIYIHEKVMGREFDQLGLDVTPGELFALIKSDQPNPRLQRYFTDPNSGQIIPQFADPVTGRLSSQKVLSYLSQLFEAGKNDQWLPIEKELKIERRSSKYYNLIKKGLYTSSFEAESENLSANNKMNISFVGRLYDEMEDGEVSWDDSDISAYYNEHKNELPYQQNETMRSIEYVAYEVIPSEEDKAVVKNGLEKIKSEFIREKSDTAFIIENSDSRGQVNWFTYANIPGGLDSTFMNDTLGSVKGPYEDAGSYKLAKILAIKMAPDSVNARHILIKINEGDTARAMATADSLKKVSKSQGNFAELAKSFSEDFGSGEKGGDLDWFTEGQMVPAFNDACFTGKVGDMPIVTSQFGIHLIEIKEQTQPKKKILIGFVDHQIHPGKETVSKSYNDCSSFRINNNTPELFRTAGNEIGLRVADNIKEGDKVLAGLDDPRQLIRWTYNANQGDLSEPLELGNKFVIAHLTQIKQKGTLPLAVVKERIEQEVIKEKKAEMFLTELDGSTDLNALAAKFNKEVQTQENIAFSAYAVPGMSGEKELLGYIFAMEQGQVSKPLKGTRGVYVVKIDLKNDAVSNTDLSSTRTQLERSNQGRVDYDVFNALKEKANIKDNRGKFF